MSVCWEPNGDVDRAGFTGDFGDQATITLVDDGRGLTILVNTDLDPAGPSAVVGAIDLMMTAAGYPDWRARMKTGRLS